MSDFDAREWQPGEQLPAGELNRIERGVKAAHDKIDGGEALAAAQEAARVAVAESSIIGSARVQGGRLLFTRNDGTELDAGSVAGTKGDKGDDGAGLVTYASIAELDAAASAQTGIVYVPDLSAFLSESAGVADYFGASATLLVETAVTVLSDGDVVHAQFTATTNPMTWEPEDWVRVRGQFGGGAMSAWSEWFWKFANAGTGTRGFVQIASNTEAQSFATSGTSGAKAVIVSNLNAIAVSAPTANRIIRRDGNGRAQVATPSAAADIATKGYVDTGGWSTVPATATSAGTAGAVARDASWLYVCTATNTWRRVALAAW